MKKCKRFRSLGFTLIELLIVISIIGVLSSIVVSSTGNARAKGRDAYRVSQIREVQTALELYYSAYDGYPSNAFPLTFGDNVPHNWASMIGVLNGTGFIHATFSMEDRAKEWPRFTLARIAYALVAIYYDCSLQDPLYNTSSDFSYSYGYVASADQKSYKIRMYIETDNSRLFQSSLDGAFLDSETTGVTACDSSLHYYCVGR